jgi:hypothetical protein
VAIVDSVQFIGDEPKAVQLDTMVNAGRSISESIGFKIGRARQAA